MSPHRRRHPRRDMLRDCHPPVLLPVVLRGSLDSLCFLKKISSKILTLFYFYRRFCRITSGGGGRSWAGRRRRCTSSVTAPITSSPRWSPSDLPTASFILAIRSSWLSWFFFSLVSLSRSF